MSAVIMPVIPGGINSHRDAAREAIRVGAVKNGIEEADPLTMLAEIASDPNNDPSLRAAVWKDLAGYVYPKVKQVEVDQRPVVVESSERDQIEARNRLKEMIDEQAGNKARLYLVKQEAVQDAEVVDEDDA